MDVLNEDQKIFMREAVNATKTLNSALKAMRESGISCNIREYDGHWFVDARLIIKSSHY